MLCQKCGNSVTEGTDFCAVCRNKIDQTADIKPGIITDKNSDVNEARPAPNLNSTGTNSESCEKIYSVSQWFGTFLLLFIPVVNIILLFVWAFSNKINKNKKNWARASLFIAVIIIILLVILYAVLVAMFNNLFSE